MSLELYAKMTSFPHHHGGRNNGRCCTLYDPSCADLIWRFEAENCGISSQAAFIQEARKRQEVFSRNDAARLPIRNCWATNAGYRGGGACPP